MSVYQPMSGGYDDTNSVATPQPQAAQPQPVQQPLPEFSYDLGGVNPTTDLLYNSYLRGAGFDKASARAQADYARQQLNAQMQSAIPGFQQQLKEGLVDIGESAAARGAARSSSRVQDQNRFQRDVASKESAFRQGIVDQQAQIAFQLQDQMNSIERQRGEQELDARMRLVEEQNRQIAYQRALKELGLV